MLIGFIASKATVISVRLLKGILSGAVEVKQARRATKALRERAKGSLSSEQEGDLIYPSAVLMPGKKVELSCTLREWRQMESGTFDPVVIARGARRHGARKKIEARMAASEV